MAFKMIEFAPGDVLPSAHFNEMQKVLSALESGTTVNGDGTSIAFAYGTGGITATFTYADGTAHTYTIALDSATGMPISIGVGDTACAITWDGFSDSPLIGTVESEDYPGCFYRNVDGTQEWINPPMVIDTEYRTAERHNGNAVYTRLIYFSDYSGSANDIKQKGIEMGVMPNIISISGVVTDAYYESSPITSYGTLTAAWEASESTLYVGGMLSKALANGATAYVTIKYTID